jgi:hypothetical protein
VVTSRYSGDPGVLLTLHTSPQVIGIEFVETAPGQVQPVGSGFGFYLTGAKGGEKVAD